MSFENETYHRDETPHLFECEGASAKIIVSETNRLVHVDHIEAHQTGQGAGSALLNKLKAEYPDYTIEGTAMPYDRENEHDELSEKEIEDYIFLEAEAEHGALPSEQLKKMHSLRDRGLAHLKFDPFSRLQKFYKENHFTIGFDGHFISTPPHRLKEI